MKMILVTPAADPGALYYLAYQELIPTQLFGNPEKGIPGAYFRAYDRDLETRVIEKYAEIITRSKTPVYEQDEFFDIETLNDTWYMAKVYMK